MISGGAKIIFKDSQIKYINNFKNYKIKNTHMYYIYYFLIYKKISSSQLYMIPTKFDFFLLNHVYYHLNYINHN